MRGMATAKRGEKEEIEDCTFKRGYVWTIEDKKSLYTKK